MTLLEWAVANVTHWSCDSVLVKTAHGYDYCHRSRVSSGVEFVTKQQWLEARGGATKNKVAPVWSGEGLPPVGCECEIKRVADWMPVTIKFISDYHTVFTTFVGTEDCYQTTSLHFRPIRSEADRKRDEVIEALTKYTLRGDASDIYDAIAAGKIPGIRIE